MRIKRLILKGYIPFTYNKVTELDWTIDKPIQIIIGTNGCGKSSLLRETTPYPACKSDFLKDGYKQITIDHRRSEYILTSDFGNKVYTHSFIRDGVELNESGLSTIQEELVEKHLGYTKHVHSIITQRYKISAITPSQRRGFLLSINPFQLGFIVEKHKQVTAQIKTFKANLMMLHNRKVILETEMISDENLQALKKENEQIAQDLAQCMTHLNRLDVMQGMYRQENQSPFDFDQCRRDILAFTQRSSRYTTIDRHSVSDDYEKLQSKKAYLVYEITSIKEQIASVLNEINKYNTLLSSKDNSSSVSLLKEQIEGMSKKITHYECLFPGGKLPYLSQLSYLNDKDRVLTKIQDLVSQFIGGSTYIIPSKTYHRYKEKHISLGRRLRQSEHDLKTYQQKLDETETLIQSKTYNVPKNCHNQSCELLLRYHDVQASLLKEKTTLEEQVRRLHHSTERLSNVVAQLTDVLQRCEPFKLLLDQLTGVFQTHPYLKPTLEMFDIYQVLRNNPIQLHTTIRDLYQELEDYQTYQSLKQEKEKLIASFNALASDETNVEFIRSLKDEKIVVCETYKTKLSLEELRLSSVEDKIALYDQFFKDRVLVQSYQEKLKTYDEYCQKSHMQEIVKTMIASLTEIKTDLSERLGTVTSSIQRQENIASRLNEEIVYQIQQIEKVYEDYVAVEKALSPTSGIPHKYTLSFINTLFKNTNYFLNKIFSYPLEIKLLKDVDTLDYKFPVRAHDKDISDISICSTAQQEAINIAFSLALMVQLKLTDYPIYLDECGSTFDTYHKQQLIDLLIMITEGAVVSQLYLINHHATIHGGLTNSDTMVLNPDNVLVPEIYNTHVQLKKE